jgi:hypothetical protein
MKRATLVMTVVALLVGGVGQARAGVISDSLTVFDSTGAIFAQVSSAEDSTEDNTVISFIDPSLVGVDPTQFTKSTILIEPGGNALNGPYLISALSSS